MKDTPSKTETANADVIAIIENRLERLGTFKEYVFEREKLALDAEARSPVFHPRRQPTSCSATNLTWTVSFIAPWISWSNSNDNGRAKSYRRL
jgi:hypothetical protein